MIDLTYLTYFLDLGGGGRGWGRMGRILNDDHELNTPIICIASAGLLTEYLI